MVVILDPRIRSKPYGRLFLASLPDCRRVIEQVEEGEGLGIGD
jgi:ATP-dependent DNA helicase DinG